MEIKKPKVETKMLLLWTVIFTIVSFPLNALIFREATPEFIRLPYVILGYLFFIGIIVSWVEVAFRKIRGKAK
ncbi:MAG: hypothetical protein AUJ74_05185 [Candidatus Omnitrophica bacterium CG1_02_44_16]|nr:MAG: hypothetical protein AUJ74_05185 [Candidatus Omnitrophica bacterium CG1_02_44_16]PIY82948.1 MAG: hypothetical protein COY78_04125 [Candidatus Omnitrophica bacterium CG_4_10_14_0_8_um_filter_44_12]PIZ83577.1 MAG: hypothetical protein COX96_07435 [Candidatus Omnitrophica bacterium CG_4_10_14_0_2_um_filter_44_9]